MDDVLINTPTWSAVLPMLLLGIREGNEAGRKIAAEELARMAAAADAWNAHVEAAR
jgi:hypothetical protein